MLLNLMEKKLKNKRIKKGKKEIVRQDRSSPRQLAFMNCYLSEQIDGKPNPCFNNASKAAKKVGYSASYARQILGRIEKQNGANAEKLAEVRKSVKQALEDQGVTSDRIAALIVRLMDKNDKRNIGKKLVDTGDPDSHAARVALENVARLLGLYEPDKLDINQFSNLSDADIETEFAGIISEVSEGLAVIKRSQKKGGK